MAALERLANRVRDLRRGRALTQQSLAERVGVTRQTIIAVEQGRFAPSVRLALLLARALDVPLQELFWIEEEANQ
jgi:putative transcriptional regulator